MIYRSIALFTAIVVGLATMLPLVTVEAEAGQQRTQKRAKKNGKKFRKYSKQWWRAYRLRNNRQKTLNARKRTLRLRQIRLANALAASENNQAIPNGSFKAGNKMMLVSDSAPTMLPSGEAAPKGWKRGASSTGEMQYRVEDETGLNIGSAAISVVGPAIGADNPNSPMNKTVGGVATSALRRTVIDRMIREEGWVVNDFQKQIGDRKVYVVVAQSPGAGGAAQSRLFYFTEVDGRIYSVAASAPKDNSARIEQESEKAVNSLQRKINSVQQAELK